MTDTMAGDYEAARLRLLDTFHTTRLTRDVTVNCDDLHTLLYAAQPSAGAQGEAVGMPLSGDRSIDEMSEIADRWMEQASVRQMVQAISSVFSKWADDSLIHRFHDQIMTIVRQSFIEGSMYSCATPAQPDTGAVEALREARGIIDSYFMDDDYDANGALRKASAVIDAALSTANTQGGAG